MSAPGDITSLEQGENSNVAAPKSYRNRIVSVVSVALVMTGGAFLVANSRGSVTSSSVTNLAKESSAPQQAKLPMKVDMDRVEVPKGVTSKDEKKGTDEKKDVDVREEVDGGKPVSKKTAKPTVKPTTPPKPTVPPTTKKPSEKKDVKEEVRVDGPKGMTKKSEANADKGLAPPARQLVGISSMPPPRGAEEESEPEHPTEKEVDGGKPVSKKTAKPTVNPTTAPKPTVPPKTGKPAEKHANLATEDKHASSDSRLEGPKGMDHKSENNAKAGMAPPARSLSSQEFGGPKKAAAATPVVTSMKASVLDLFGGKSGKTKKPSSAPSFPPLGGKPTPPPVTGKPVEKKSKEEDAPKGVTSDREEGPKGMSKATIKKDNGGFTPPRQLENRKEAAPAPKDAPAGKTAVMSPPKKAEAPKEEKKEEKKGDVVAREEVDGGKPVSKKTAKPTVKPTTPPKPTVPPTTKKPSEKKGEMKEEVRVEGPKLHPSRMLSEVRGKVTPSSSSVRGSKGKTEKPVEGPPAPHAEPKGPRALSAVPVTKDDADPCHDGLSPRCTPPTSKPVEHRMLTEKTASSVSQAAKNAIYGLSGPTKSPSTGLHKPTWKPTNGTPTGKPLEQGAKSSIASKSDATSEVVAAEQAKNEVQVESKSSSSSAGSKTTPSSGSNKKVLMHDGAPSSRQLSETDSVPTKSPSSGLHKPTWKPSSKPAEQVTAAAKTEEVVVVEDTTTTTTTTSADTTASKTSNTNRESGPKGATKKLAHDGAPTTRNLANAHPGDLTTSTAGKGAFAEVGPSKSPSTGIHKPTWKPTQGKPSGKPVEPWKEGVESAHTEMKNSAHVEGELEKTHTARELKVTAPVNKDDADPCHDGLSPRCTPPTSKPVEHRSLAGSPTKSPSSGLHKPTWKPSSKPNEHRQLAGTPTKSPSSGLHKPTWKPSSKPAEK